MGAMAATHEAPLTADRARPSGSGIVIASDRTANRQAARRHTARVRVLKIALPLTSFLLLAVFAAPVVKTFGLGAAMPDIAMPQILPESLKMENPHYEGFNADGGRYWVKADYAQQDLKSLSVIRLTRISGELVDAEKKTTRLAAKRGAFNNKSSVLELFDDIAVDGDDGLKARLTRATIKTKEGLITSDAPVSVAMTAGTITAKQMSIQQKSKEFAFVDNVRTHLNAKSQADAASAQQTAPQAAEQTDAKPSFAFGDAGKPIDIASNRLDVNDKTKLAIFTADVTAIQGTSSLTTPELSVTYEGEAVKTDAKAATQSGKVKRIVAKGPVVLTDAEQRRVTSQSADFDPLAETALLEGDVVMTEGTDKRVTGDRALFDQKTGTLEMTGPVVLTQGDNVLKGRRLTFNRTTSRMQLTGEGAGSAGRITAHFKQNGDKTSTAGSDAEAPTKGISFGATFRTDPGAPVDIEADRLDVDDAAKRAVFAGGVRAKQGDFIINAAELTAAYAGSATLAGTAQPSNAQPSARLTRIEARKKVLITSKDGQSATGDWADFDTKANIATLGGNVVLTQGKNVVRGTKLVIDMNTGQSTIKTEATDTPGGSMISSSAGDGDGKITKSSRPSAIFYPNDFKNQANKTKQAVDGWQTRSAP